MDLKEYVMKLLTQTVRLWCLVLGGCLLVNSGVAFEESARSTEGNLQAIFHDLRSEDRGKRQDAVRRLGNLRPITPDVIAGFELALKDKDAHVREQAVWTLGRIGPPAKGSVQLLLAVLGDETESYKVRARVPDALVKIQASAVPGVVSSLMKIATDPEEEVEVRASAIKGLGDFGQEAREALGALSKVATTAASDTVRVRARLTLARIKPDDEEFVREVVDISLGKYGEKFGPDKETRPRSYDLAWEAIDTLLEINQQEKALPALIEAVAAGGEETVRAASTLGEMGSAARPSIPTLINVLQKPARTEEDRSIKAWVMNSLIYIDPTSEQVSAALGELAATDPNPRLRKLAADLLECTRPDSPRRQTYPCVPLPKVHDAFH